MSEEAIMSTNQTCVWRRNVVSRAFPIQACILTSLKPYVAADRPQRTSGPHYQSSHEYAGLTLNLIQGFPVDRERTVTQSSDDLPVTV